MSETESDVDLPVVPKERRHRFKKFDEQLAQVQPPCLPSTLCCHCVHARAHHHCVADIMAL